MNYKSTVTVLLALSCLISCATPEKKDNKLYVWPAAPAEPRISFEYRLTNAQSVKINNAEDNLRQLATGSSALRQTAMLKPYDIVASRGRVLVTDSLLAVVHVFDIVRHKLFAIGWRKEGKLIKPLGIAIDNAQNIYVADAGRKQVIKFDSLGLYLGTVGNPEDFSRISDVAVSSIDGSVYVLDRGGVDSDKHQITKYSAEGKKLLVIAGRGHEPGYLNHPTQLAISNDNEIYVLDSGNFRVEVFSAEGQYLRHWGRLGNRSGHLARPRGIAVDAGDRVYVTDSAFQNYQIFTKNGQLLLSVGAASRSNHPASFQLPAGIATDESRFIYVVDQVLRKVEVFRLIAEVPNGATTNLPE